MSEWDRFKKALEQSRKGEPLGLDEQEFELFSAIQADGVTRAFQKDRPDYLKISHEANMRYGIAKTDLRLDRPSREKVERILDELLFSPGESKDGYTYNLTRCIDKIIAFLPDEAPEGLLEATIKVRCEAAKREERERIRDGLGQVYLISNRLGEFLDNMKAFWQNLKEKQ